jgi:hypothetical protein
MNFSPWPGSFARIYDLLILIFFTQIEANINMWWTSVEILMLERQSENCFQYEYVQLFPAAAAVLRLAAIPNQESI